MVRRAGQFFFFSNCVLEIAGAREALEEIEIWNSQAGRLTLDWGWSDALSSHPVPATPSQGDRPLIPET